MLLNPVDKNSSIIRNIDRELAKHFNFKDKMCSSEEKVEKILEKIALGYLVMKMKSQILRIKMSYYWCKMPEHLHYISIKYFKHFSRYFSNVLVAQKY